MARELRVAREIRLAPDRRQAEGETGRRGRGLGRLPLVLAVSSSAVALLAVFPRAAAILAYGSYRLALGSDRAVPSGLGDAFDPLYTGLREGRQSSRCLALSGAECVGPDYSLARRARVVPHCAAFWTR